jgi:hypothetical protein
VTRQSKATKEAEQAYRSDSLFEDDQQAQGGTLAVPETLPSSVQQVRADLVLHTSDRPIVWAKLAQHTSEEGTEGKFYFAETSEEVDDLILIPARIQVERTLWPQAAFSRGRKPECSSEDGVYAVSSYPDGTLPLFPGATCTRCGFYVPKPWLAEPGQRMCQAGYSIQGFSVSTLELVAMRLYGSAAKVARVMARPGVFRHRPMRLYSKPKSSDSGKWHQLMAEVLDPLSAEQMATIQELLASEEMPVA